MCWTRVGMRSKSRRDALRASSNRFRVTSESLKRTLWETLAIIKIGVIGLLKIRFCLIENYYNSYFLHYMSIDEETRFATMHR